MKTAIIILALLCAGCNPRSSVRTGAASDTYDPVVYRDLKTGCEYLSTGQINTLTPRMDASGKQICEVKP